MNRTSTSKSPDGGSGEKELVARLRNGDQQAFSQMYEKYYQNIHNYILKQVRDRSEAEDLAQETFIQAYRSISSFEGRSRLLTWLISIARYTCLKFYRFASRWMIGAQSVAFEYDQGFDSEIEERLDAKLILDRCDVLIGRLRSPRDRFIFRLRYIEGMPICGIAEHIGKTRDSVKTSLWRIRMTILDNLRTGDGIIAMAA